MLAALPLILVAGFGADAVANWITRLARENPAEAAARLRLVIWVVAAVTVLPLAGFAARTWHFAGRVAAARRFPPPGTAVVHDVRVLEGRAALVYAGLGRAVALCLALCCALLAWITWFALACLERSSGPAG